ncbi:MAG: hypothetical protein JSW61_03410 [Candidatus Thorarchaeota archaeon]|nr:MAG: hypothetical protein JSW61_03410 [Candidatus Thorarchaeota archaeon]
MADKKFSRDMKELLSQLEPITDSETVHQLIEIKDRLVELNRKRLVKINHSVMQVLCAKHLIEQGYDVTVEHPLVGGQLNADLFAIRDREPELEHNIESVLISERLGLPVEKEALVVEVETGYVPPKAALYPSRYRKTRIAAKIARYCRYSHRFGLATPNYHVLQIPEILLKPPELRDIEEIRRIKEECDQIYKSPPILLDALAMSETDYVYIINVDQINVTQLPPHEYLDTVLPTRGLTFH